MTIIYVNLNAQDLNYCGTKDGKVNWLQEWQKDPKNQFLRRDDELLMVPITIWIVGTDAGSGYFSLNNTYKALCQLNRDYEPHHVQFYLSGPIKYLNNTSWYDHDWDAGDELMRKNRVANTINNYIVQSPAGNCGYSAYGKGIALAKSCLGASDHTWAHEMGHQLSLPHTFFGWEGITATPNEVAPATVGGTQVELVDGSNCTTSSDGFCDTPVDFLSYRWSCNSNSESPNDYLDPNGVKFKAQGKYYMSYSLDACMTTFSPLQVQAMRDNLRGDKKNMLNPNLVVEKSINGIPVNVISPIINDTIENNNIDIVWNKIDGATYYSVELSQLADFSPLTVNITTSDTSYLVNTLAANRKFYTRIKAYNNFSFCLAEPEIITFRTKQLVGTNDQKAPELSIYPTVIGNGQILNILGLEQGQPTTVDMLDVTGRMLQTYKMLPNGSDKVQINDTPAGTYFIKIHNSKWSKIQKLTVF